MDKPTQKKIGRPPKEVPKSGQIKLYKHTVRKYKGKKYYNHVIILPSKMRQHLGWEGGKMLNYHIQKGRLILAQDAHSKNMGD